MSKSGRTTVGPARIAADFGTDALRWWFACEVRAVADTDFTIGVVVVGVDRPQQRQGSPIVLPLATNRTDASMHRAFVAAALVSRRPGGREGGRRRWPGGQRRCRAC